MVALSARLSNYWTQGETLHDLKDHLRDLYNDLTSGQIPGIRRGV